MKKPNVAKSNYFRLNFDANGASSLALWLSEEPEYIFNEFKMVIKLKWNCWAEGICNPIILMSQHKENSGRDIMGLYYFCSCLCRLCAWLLELLPFGKCTPPSPFKLSPSCRCQIRFQPLHEALPDHQSHLSLKAGGGVWAPKTQSCVSCHNSPLLCGNATCKAASVS